MQSTTCSEWQRCEAFSSGILNPSAVPGGVDENVILAVALLYDGFDFARHCFQRDASSQRDLAPFFGLKEAQNKSWNRK